MATASEPWWPLTFMTPYYDRSKHVCVVKMPHALVTITTYDHLDHYYIDSNGWKNERHTVSELIEVRCILQSISDAAPRNVI